jgi:hypothetical protein
MNLFINFYIDPNPIRQAEIEIALRKNIENESIKKIVIYGEVFSLKVIVDNFKLDKILAYPYNNRPTFNDLFTATQTYSNDINIISNSDIYFDDTLSLLNNYDFTGKCLALSRWDALSNGEAIHFDRADTNDCWIMKGAFPIIEEANFCLGFLGSDNRINYLIHRAGYNVINPSKTIRAIHLHESGIRNYIRSEETVVKPPYYLTPSSEL